MFVTCLNIKFVDGYPNLGYARLNCPWEKQPYTSKYYIQLRYIFGQWEICQVLLENYSCIRMQRREQIWNQSAMKDFWTIGAVIYSYTQIKRWVKISEHSVKNQLFWPLTNLLRSWSIINFKPKQSNIRKWRCIII